MNKKILLTGSILVVVVVCCFALYLNINKKNNTSKIPVKAKCNFELLDLKVSRYHKDGPDLNKIKELEEESKKPCSYNGVGINWCEMGRSMDVSNLNSEKNSKDKLTWIEIEGIIKVGGNNEQNLKDIISKVYTNNDKKIFLGEAYSNIDKMLSPGTSYPFKMSVELNRNVELISKYFNKDDKVKIDTYPYFLNCEY